ncbi:hypothetical protein OS493_009250 [Desmophyllum pertusum]|uniref:Uncharacterized protein n=1 Tax=Desmophyllum pertusum TaxID=174260 RepID=A0A9W9Z2P8_9CNID|nr:hypothetical protein OS493_009250 [Desmophyllum pertusum]
MIYEGCITALRDGVFCHCLTGWLHADSGRSKDAITKCGPERERPWVNSSVNSKRTEKDVQAAVEACLKAAEEKTTGDLGVRRRYKCVTTKKDSPADFDRYGSSVTCKEQGDYGVGIKRATFVYILKKGE